MVPERISKRTQKYIFMNETNLKRQMIGELLRRLSRELFLSETSRLWRNFNSCLSCLIRRDCVTKATKNRDRDYLQLQIGSKTNVSRKVLLLFSFIIGALNITCLQNEARLP